MADKVYKLWLKVFDGLRDGTIPGLQQPPPPEEKRAPRRFHYKNVAAFPEVFYEETFGALLSDDASKSKAVVNLTTQVFVKKAETQWASPSTNDWFLALKEFSTWTSKFETYRQFRGLLKAAIPPEDPRKVQVWEAKFSTLVPWDPHSDDKAAAYTNDKWRDFVESLVPAGRDPLSTPKRKAQEKDWGRLGVPEGKFPYYATVTAGLKKYVDWFPQFAEPRAAQEPGSGAKAVMQKILENWQKIAYPPAKEEAEDPPSVPDLKFQREGIVVVRPKCEHNLKLTGAGDGLEKLTTVARLFCAPFLKAGQKWLSKQPYLLYSRAALTEYLQTAVVAPLLELAYKICTVGTCQSLLCV